MATSEPHADSRLDQVVISLRGELDFLSGSAPLDALATPAISGRFVLVDLTQVDHLDRSALDSLMHARAVARESGGDLVLVNPSGSVLKSLTTLGLTDALPVAFSPPMNATAPVSLHSPFSSAVSDLFPRHFRPFRAVWQSVAAYLFSALPTVHSKRSRHHHHRHTG
jgi:anti-anti-sigma factor